MAQGQFTKQEAEATAEAKKSAELWIAGQINESNYREWEFQGVFDSKANAVAACEDGNWFIGPAKLNERLPSESQDWPEAYYPKRE